MVGRIGRAHGVRGEVAVDVRTDDPEHRFAQGASLVTEPALDAPLTVEATRWHSGRLLVSFAGVEDRSAADELRGRFLVVDLDPEERPADPEEFFDHQLIGLSVRTTGGLDVGAVSDVLHLPAQDLLSVRQTDGRESLVPFVAAIVPSVDLDAGVLWLDPPPGLLDDLPGG